TKTSAHNIDSHNALLLSKTLEALISGQDQPRKEALAIGTQILGYSNISNDEAIWANLSKTLIKSYEKAYLPALFSAYKTHNLLEKSSAGTPEIQACINLFNALHQSIPASYYKTLRLAGFSPIDLPQKGNQPETELSRTIDVFRQTVVNKQEPRKEQNTNAVTALLIANYYLKNNQPQNALNTLKNIDTLRSNLPINYYYKGNALLNLGQYQKANYYFDKFLFQQATGSFIKSALLRKMWIAIIHQQPYKHYPKLIFERGNTYTFTDRQAEKEADKQYHSTLLQMRLLFDGGNYSKACTIGLQTNTKNLSDAQQAEYYYRMGRISNALNDTSKALSYYHQVLKHPNSGEYYHKKSLVEAGKIQLKMKNRDRAIRLLKQALETQSNEYSDALNQEAASLLENLE
ncbi:MAG: tetratricopeptide repeat protein, partial [Salinivirgaceae bacterium]